MVIFHGVNPKPRPPDIVQWAEDSVRLPGSALSERFDCSITPWLREPLERIGDVETRIITLVKPIQSGGSCVGEIALCHWASYARGIVQNNWPKDERARSRWNERIRPALEKCKSVRWSGDRFDRTICQANLIGGVVKVQGVFNADSLDSDSVPYQVNEEIHSWKPGHMAKARGRQTAVWFAKAVDISNAGFVGDQLENEYLVGTQQVWTVRCPGCGKFHLMQTRWEDSKPNLGGLRYDTTGCKRDDGSFDYNKLRGTIRYQMPCGFEVHDTPRERKSLSNSGKYSEPQNTGATLLHRSYNYDAVIVDYIPWLKLIQEKHTALRALKHGDSEPWRRYKQERECVFYNEEMRPFQGRVVVNVKLTKNRAGLEGRAARLWAADKQKGYRSQGELSHYWLVIRDVMANGDSCLVYEGQIATETELLAVLDDHNCPRYAGGVDGSWDTKTVLEFCYRSGLNAFMANVSHKGWFMHSADKVKRFYSEGKPLHMDLNMPPRFNYSGTAQGWLPAREEPMIINYNVAGLLANLFFIRDHEQTVRANSVSGDFISWEVPGDASDDYRQQNESWERTAIKQVKTNDDVEGFKKIRKDDHMLMCEGYIAMMMDIGGFLAGRLSSLGLRQQSEKQE